MTAVVFCAAMRGMFDRLKSIWLWLIAGSLLVVLLVAAGLQFHWINQLSDADRRQREEVLDISTRNFRYEFRDAVLSTMPLFRQSAGFPAGADFEKLMAERLANWQRESNRPFLIRSIALGLETASGQFAFKRLKTADSKFSEQSWPNDLANYRLMLEKQLRLPNGLPPFYPRGFATELVENHPVIIFPLVEETVSFISREQAESPMPPTDSQKDFQTLMSVMIPADERNFPDRPKLKGWAFLEFDEEFIRSNMFPELLERHFGRQQADQFKIAIIVGQPVKTIFQAGEPMTAEEFSKPDARTTIFRGQAQLPSAEPAAPERRRADRPRPPRPPGRPGAGNNPPPRPEREPLVESDDKAAWQLVVKYQAGSLEEAVGRTRRNNLILSFGALIILGGSIVLLALAAQRSRRLAEQQMEFVAGVSHELRTPLAVIQSTSFNLARGTVSDPGRVQQYGSAIQTEVRRLVNQIEQMLSFAGIQSGKNLYDLRPINVAEIVERSLGEFAESLNESCWQVEKQIPADLPKALADAPSLESAIKNLIQNAMKYAAEGKWLGVTVSADNSQLRIAIADHGTGIDPTDLPHIFKPFYRGKKVLASTVSGAGLGLSLVDRHLKAMGGKVTVISSPEFGTTFTLHLPVSVDQANAAR